MADGTKEDSDYNDGSVKSNAVSSHEINLSQTIMNNILRDIPNVVVCQHFAIMALHGVEIVTEALVEDTTIIHI